MSSGVPIFRANTIIILLIIMHVHAFIHATCLYALMHFCWYMYVSVKQADMQAGMNTCMHAHACMF